MKTKLLTGSGQRIYALVFEAGDECVAGIQEFAVREWLDSTHFTAIGAFERVVLQYFNPATKAYEDIPVGQQVEVLSLIGNIATDGEGLKVHAHCVVGLPDGTTRGGHLKEGYVFPTLEVVLEETPRELRRRHDPGSGLALIDLDLP
ncbi:MAG: PPC domain-containing DNA-binding protein [Hyphomicrobiales bacterium]